MIINKNKEENDMSKTKVFNYVCAGLTLILLVLQFTPFWNYNGQTASINGFVWLNPQGPEINSWFASQLGAAVNVNSVVITSVLVLLLGAAGVVLCIMKSDIGLMALLPAAASLSGIYAFALKPVFRLGSTWIIQLVLCIAILAVAIFTVVNSLKKEQ